MIIAKRKAFSGTYFFNAILQALQRLMISQKGLDQTMSIYVIVSILLLLVSLAAYSFLSHSIEKRRIQRQRLITALRARRNSFRDLATGFPNGFLSNDLSAFLYRSLIDACEQLVRLEPKEPTHAEQLNLYTNLLTAQKENTPQQRVRLDNPEQIKEARGLLQELYKFVMQQASLQLINQVQADAYTDQIKRLVLQMSVDGHVFNARQAQQVGKPRLAIHHYNLARKLLLGENGGHNFDKQIAQMDDIVKQLEAKLTLADKAAPTPQTDKDTEADPLATKEWEQFSEDASKWKKKQVYD